MKSTSDRRWIQLYSGAPYWPLAPEECAIGIHDIAHALANNNRFNGHTREPYSVAQHSVHVSELCEEELNRGAIITCDVAALQLPLYGLLHDASEAVLHDIVRPIKGDFRIGNYLYTAVEARIQNQILKSFGLAPPAEQVASIVARADNILLVTEQRDLMRPCKIPWHAIDAQPLDRPITPWPWREAKERFLVRFYELIEDLDP